MASLTEAAGVDPQVATPPPVPAPADHATDAPPAGSSRPATWQDLIHAEATKQGIDPRLALAVADTESSFNPDAHSRAGAHGLMQLMPGTAAHHGVDPTDPVQNIQGGVAELKALLTEHNGDVVAALRGYNASPHAPTSVTDPYVQTVLGKLQASAPPPAASGDLSQLPPMKPVASHEVGAPPPSVPYRRLVSAKTGASRPATSTDPTGPNVDLSSIDPRTTGGRRNIASGVGAAAAAALAPETGGLSFLAPILGAATGGAAAEGGEQLVGTKPPDLGEIGSAALEQGATETLGQGVMRGVVNPIGRKLLARSVASNAAGRLERTADTVNASKQALIDRLDQALRAAPSAAKAGRAVVHQAYGEGGGAKVARDLAGEQVERAAESGPAIPTAPLKAKLAELSDQITPMASHDPASALVDFRGQPLSPTQVSKISPADRASLPTLPADHPLPSTLAQVQQTLDDAGDSIPFADAHKIKRQLDDAVNWQSPAKKQAQQITKGFRQTLRTSMEGHAPYDAATAKYAAIMPLYGKGSAANGVRQVAQTNPEKIVSLLSPNQPTRAEQLVHLLTTQSAEGGDAAGGQAALQSVQAAWIHKRLITGGIDKLGARLDKLPSDFTDAFLGDAHAQETLGNLKLISQAWQAAQTASKDIPAQQAQLAASSLNTKARLPLLLPHNPLSTAAAAWRMLRGPTADDLVTWAGSSPLHTRLLVKAFTSSTPSLALADLIRQSGVIGDVGQEPPMAVSHEAPAAAGAGAVGQPPPR